MFLFDYIGELHAEVAAARLTGSNKSRSVQNIEHLLGKRFSIFRPASVVMVALILAILPELMSLVSLPKESDTNPCAFRFSRTPQSPWPPKMSVV